MKIYRSLLLITIVSLLGVGVYLTSGPTFAQGGLDIMPNDWYEQMVGPIEPELAGIGDGMPLVPPPNHNPHPLIVSELVPGFRLDSSTYDQALQLVEEKWIKEPAPGLTEPTFITLRLSLLGSREETLAAARKRFFATINDEFSGDDCPRSGSYSGQTIGDNCWAFTRGVAPPPRGNLNPVSTVIVIKNSDLFTLRVSCVDGGVADSFTDGLANAVVERLNTWPRPGGNSPGLQLQAQVISKHVKPHKQERAEIRITSNASPASYGVEVQRQGQTVYRTQVSGQTSPYLFVWGGIKGDGQRAENGNHEVVVTATDSFGRTVTQTVQIVVNFQGK